MNHFTDINDTSFNPSNDIYDAKQFLRKQYRQKRNQLSFSEVQQYSEQIACQLFTTPFWKQSQTIMLYLAFQNEVATKAIYQQGWRENKIMLLPICAPVNGLMEMSILSSLDALQPNRYGIGELPLALQRIVLPSQIDLCIIPGIAFDHTGTRLGFGAGYYDRYLTRVNPSAPRIALAYECQIHKTPLPADAYDLPMHYILTEQHLYQIKSEK